MARKINTIIVGESKYGKIKKGYTINPERAKIYKWMELVDDIMKFPLNFTVRSGITVFEIPAEKIQEVHYK